MTEFTTIRYEIEDRICSIVLNRPEKLNALSTTVTAEVETALALAVEDESVRVIVLRGEGRCFSAGADLDEKTEVPNVQDLLRRHTSLGGRHYWALWDAPKPVIASVHGYCLAGAVWMAAMCDMTIASDDAVFGMPTIRFNQHPAIMPLAALMGIKFAKELMLTGSQIDAHRAERMGLVNRVVPADRLLDETYALAAEMAALPSVALAMYKRAVNRVYEIDGITTLADVGSEVLSYFNAMQSFGDAADNGFRDRVREVGVAQAVRERDAASDSSA